MPYVGDEDETLENTSEEDSSETQEQPSEEEDLSYPEPGAGPEQFDNGYSEDEYDETEEIEDEVLTQPEPEQGDAPRKAQAPEKSTPEKKKPTGNPHAAARIAARENQILRQRTEQLLALLEDREAERLSASTPAEKPEPEEEVQIPTFDEDPLKHIAARLDKMEREKAKESKQSEEKSKQSEVKQYLNESNRLIKDFVSKVGVENYNAATQFLAQAKVEEILEENPGFSQADAVKAATLWINNQRIHNVANGKNPGEFFYNKAKKFGFQAKAVASQTGKEKITSKSNPARDSASKTLSAASGIGAKKVVSVDDVLRYQGDHWDNFISEKAKSLGKKSGDIVMSDILAPTR